MACESVVRRPYSACVQTFANWRYNSAPGRTPCPLGTRLAATIRAPYTSNITLTLIPQVTCVLRWVQAPATSAAPLSVGVADKGVEGHGADTRASPKIAAVTRNNLDQLLFTCCSHPITFVSRLRACGMCLPTSSICDRSLVDWISNRTRQPANSIMRSLRRQQSSKPPWPTVVGVPSGLHGTQDTKSPPLP